MLADNLSALLLYDWRQRPKAAPWAQAVLEDGILLGFGDGGNSGNYPAM
jgi:hypothetical protein